MHADLFNIGELTIHSYGLMISIGFLFAILMAYYRAKKFGLNTDYVFDLGVFGIIGGFLGAKLLFYIVEFRSIYSDPSRLLDVSNGFVVYGGIIGGILTGYIYCKIKKINFIEYFDLVVPSIALAQGFGRIGCFLAGCCYGKETNSFVGVVFSNSPYAPNGVKLFPVQLFSSAGSFLIAAILIVYAKKAKQRGSVAALYLILYCIGRFFIEFFRDDSRGNIGILSTSQIISICTFIFVLFFYKYLILRAKSLDKSNG